MKEDIVYFAKLIGALLVAEYITMRFIRPIADAQIRASALGETDYDPTHQERVVMGPEGPEYMGRQVVLTPGMGGVVFDPTHQDRVKMGPWGPEYYGQGVKIVPVKYSRR